MIHPEHNLSGSEPIKKREKKPTGILKDLMELRRQNIFVLDQGGRWVEWSDVEAIINKYNP